MSRITKAQIKEFTALLQSTATALGFRPYIPDPSGHGCGRENAQWAMTDAGRFHLSAHDTDPGDHALWIYGRFLDTKNPAVRHTGASLPSGKWNFYGYTPEQAVTHWADALRRAGVRPPTPEERERYDAGDLAYYATAAKSREDIRRAFNLTEATDEIPG